MDRKLSGRKLRALLSSLHQFYHNLATAAVRRDEEDARVTILGVLGKLPVGHEDQADMSDVSEGPPHPEVQEIASSFGGWLQTYLL